MSGGKGFFHVVLAAPPTRPLVDHRWMANSVPLYRCLPPTYSGVSTGDPANYFAFANRGVADVSTNNQKHWVGCLPSPSKLYFPDAKTVLTGRSCSRDGLISGVLTSQANTGGGPLEKKIPFAHTCAHSRKRRARKTCVKDPRGDCAGQKSGKICKGK